MMNEGLEDEGPRFKLQGPGFKFAWRGQGMGQYRCY